MFKTNRVNYSIRNSMKKISAAAFKKSKTNMMMVQMLLLLFLRVLLIAQ